jgi:hypothetical protein
MSVFAPVHMPSLGGATGWLNSEPLGPAGLRGHVVLVNFWTLTCINWLRQEPYVRAWSQAYRDDGEAPGKSHGVDVDEDGNGLLRKGGLYQLAREHDAVRERTLEIMFLEPGAEAYAFTFG